MKKFKLKGTNGKELTGFYLGVQLVNSCRLDYRTTSSFPQGIPLPKIVNDLDLMLIYIDENNCIWTEKIDAGDQIEML